jgi:hypothetical protein
MEPLTPGTTALVGVRLRTFSAAVPRGYRLRIAIGGADADTFARYPSSGDPTYTIERSAAAPSFVDLRQAEWNGPIPGAR